MRGKGSDRMPALRNSGKKWRFGVAVLLISAVGTYAFLKIDSIRANYGSGTAVSDPHMTRAIEEMSKQSDVFLNWAVLLLAGSIGLAIAKEPLKVRAFEWAVTLFAGPPAALLLGSAWAGWVFKRRLTYLLVNGLNDWDSLNNLLQAQASLFLIGLTVLSCFGAWLFFDRIIGTHVREKP
jgi:hypothetical protein